MPLKLGTHDIKLPCSKAYLGRNLIYQDKAKDRSNVIPDGTVYLFHFDDNLTDSIEGTLSFETNKLTATYAKFGTKSLQGWSSHSISLAKMPTKTDLVNGASGTIEFWAYGTGSGNTVMLYGDNGAGYSIMLKTNDDYSLSLTNASDSYESIEYTSENSLLNRWIHFAIVCESSNMSLFIDGNKVGTCAIQRAIARRLLKITSTKWYYDEILISTKALYKEDFTPLDKPYILPTEVGV